MTTTETIDFRKLNLEGVKTLVAWAKNEGWNPGPNDAAAFWEADKDGFYGIFSGDTMIGGGAIISYGGKYGFMGLFIVRPEYRANGIGRTLWYQRRDMLISRLSTGATIGMDGVLTMQPFYKKGGFKIAFKDERYQNTGKAMPYSSNISNITAEDFEKIASYDANCFGYPRSHFLKAWLSLPGNFNIKYEEDGLLQGMAVVRKADVGYKIGPLFADSPAIAEELYKACLNATIGEPIYLDIPTTNAAAVALVQQYGAQYIFECARMYYGSTPDTEIEKVFGITSFELG